MPKDFRLWKPIDKNNTSEARKAFLELFRDAGPMAMPEAEAEALVAGAAAARELLTVAATPEAPSTPAMPSQGEAGRERRPRRTWQEVVTNLLVYAHQHPRSNEKQEVLCKLAGGCSRNTLRKALGLDNERCPAIEALHRWYTTPGHKAPKKFFILAEANLPNEEMFGQMPATVEDATALLLDDEVEIYYRKIVALVADPVQRKSMEQADFESRRALVATAMASERYADALT